MTVHWNQFESSMNCECDVNVAWNFREDTVAASPNSVLAFSLFYFKPQLWTFQACIIDYCHFHQSYQINKLYIFKLRLSTLWKWFSVVYGNCMCWVKLSSVFREISSIMIFVGKLFPTCDFQRRLLIGRNFFIADLAYLSSSKTF